MSTVHEIKAAIEQLKPQEYAELMAMLHPFTNDDWDSQIAADAATGRLDQLVAGARDDLAAGRCRPLEELLADGSTEAER